MLVVLKLSGLTELYAADTIRPSLLSQHIRTESSAHGLSQRSEGSLDSSSCLSERIQTGARVVPAKTDEPK